MQPETKYKIKAFLWDQFYRPLLFLFNTKHIQGALIALVIIFIYYERPILTLITLSILLIIYFIEIFRYYKSGEFIKNYKDYRYPEFRKTIREIRTLRKNDEENKKPIQQGSLDSYPSETGNAQKIN